MATPLNPFLGSEMNIQDTFRDSLDRRFFEELYLGKFDNAGTFTMPTTKSAMSISARAEPAIKSLEKYQYEISRWMDDREYGKRSTRWPINLDAPTECSLSGSW